MTQKITALQRIRGIGANFAAVLVCEVLYRSFANRRQLASYVGIAPMPYQSGGMDRDRSISRAGNPRARTTLIQLAWLWLRYQPGSALPIWFRERVGTLQGRTRRIAIVAMARKLLIALWRYVETGVVPDGVEIRAKEEATAKLTEIVAGGITPGGDTGSATVFLFGGHQLPRFRWVASHRGNASCMRHYGAGALASPTACKVTQQLLRCRIARDPRNCISHSTQLGGLHAETLLTAEPSCKDEARIGQKNGQVRQWARRGTRPRQPADQRYDNAYLFGAICPARGVGAALALPYADADMMQLHLDEISRHVADGAHAVLLLDRAGWHTTGKLDVPDNITPIFLPSRAPELNPVENIWQYLRQNWLSNTVFENYDAIIDAACAAWRKLIAQPETITSIGMRDWAHVGQPL